MVGIKQHSRLAVETTPLLMSSSPGKCWLVQLKRRAPLFDQCVCVCVAKVDLSVRNDPWACVGSVNLVAVLSVPSRPAGGQTL